MYKLAVLLCACVAVVVSEPEPSVGLAYSPYYAASTYAAARPILATGYASPYLYGAGLPAAPLAYSGYSGLAPAHYIKKRSVAALPLATSYIAPSTYSYSYSSPLSYLSYGAAPIIASAPLAAPITYSHLIKKRSVTALPLAASYIAPSAVSYQSRIDYKASPYFTSYATPFAYSSPYAYSSFPYYKK